MTIGYSFATSCRIVSKVKAIDIGVGGDNLRVIDWATLQTDIENTSLDQIV